MKFFLALGLVAVIGVLTIPSTTHAQLAYGGLEVAEVPCTCAAGTLIWRFFTPLYLSGVNTASPAPVPIAGALVGPIAHTYAHYILHPGAWALGMYTPGAGVCPVGVPPFCAILPGYGLILPFSGSSL